MSHFLETQDLCIRCKPSGKNTKNYECKICEHNSTVVGFIIHAPFFWANETLSHLFGIY